MSPPRARLRLNKRTGGTVSRSFATLPIILSNCLPSPTRASPQPLETERNMMKPFASSFGVSPLSAWSTLCSGRLDEFHNRPRLRNHHKVRGSDFNRLRVGSLRHDQLVSGANGIVLG